VSLVVRLGVSILAAPGGGAWSRRRPLGEHL